MDKKHKEAFLYNLAHKFKKKKFLKNVEMNKKNPAAKYCILFHFMFLFIQYQTISKCS